MVVCGQQFAEFFDDFANVYIQLDKARTECDENKRKLMSFWLKVATDCDKNVRLITDCPQMHTPMFDFFASLNAKEKVVAFNEESLSDFYNLMHLCCLSDPNFLEKWAFHQNLDWAVKNAYLLSPAYPRTSDSIFPTLKLISDFSADYRQRNLPLVLKAAKLPQNSRNIIRYLDVLVKSQDDAISFIEKKGLEQISKYLQAKFSTGGAGGKDGEEAPKDELEATLRLLLKATDFMVSERSEKFERAIEKVMKGWEGKTVVLNALLSILELYGWSEDKLVLECYKMIKRLCGYVNACPTLFPTCVCHSPRVPTDWTRRGLCWSRRSRRCTWRSRTSSSPSRSRPAATGRLWAGRSPTLCRASAPWPSSASPPRTGRGPTTPAAQR
jgi:hypothetical protein